MRPEFGGQLALSAGAFHVTELAQHFAELNSRPRVTRIRFDSPAKNGARVLESAGRLVRRAQVEEQFHIARGPNYTGLECGYVPWGIELTPDGFIRNVAYGRWSLVRQAGQGQQDACQEKARQGDGRGPTGPDDGHLVSYIGGMLASW